MNDTSDEGLTTRLANRAEDAIRCAEESERELRKARLRIAELEMELATLRPADEP
jgi:hypothetical protein